MNVHKICGIIIVFLISSRFTGALIDLGEIGCTATAGDCPANNTCRAYCRNNCVRNGTIWGTTVYPLFSPICKSAAHDFRLSLWNESERIVLFNRAQATDVFYGSKRFGISSKSYDFSPAKVSCYKFSSPHISENILDIASLHRGYFFREGESHTQECFTSSTNLKVKFNTYSKKNNSSILIAIETVIGGVTLKKAVWSEQTYLTSDSAKNFNAGFQCTPENHTLSTITSLAFRRDAYFLPPKLTITVNVNETVSLDMLEHEVYDKGTVWKKDGRVIKDILPQSISQTSVTLSNAEIGYAGIYSLEYRDYDIERRGYVRLIVRTCPDGKYGDFCDKTCPQCLNGGICHDFYGVCLCPPGFNGPTCENVCDPGSFGKNCNMKCALGSEDEMQSCKGVLICLPDPYGCSCAAGYTGIFCDRTCQPGTYGAGCSEKRNCHCANGQNCNPFSGFCDDGCAGNWHGRNCDEKSIKVIELSYNPISSFAVNLTWGQPSGLDKNVRYYVVTYQQVGWRHLCNFPVDDKIFQLNTTETCIVLDNLEPFAIYKIRVSAIAFISSEDAYNNDTESEIIVKTSSAIPPPPTYFHVHERTASSLYLDWASPFPPGGILDYYKLSYRDLENDFVGDVTVNISENDCGNQSSVHCCALNDLVPNHLYEIELMAFNKNVRRGSETVSIIAKTAASDPIGDFKVLVSEHQRDEVVIKIWPGIKSAEAYSAYLIVVEAVDTEHPSSNFSYYVPKELSCSGAPSSDAQTYIAAKISRIPINGIKFTIGNKNCLNGYFNKPLRRGKQYRFGVAALIKFCQKEVYSSIVFAHETVSVGALKNPQSKTLSITLGFLLPLIVIIVIILVLLYLQKSKKFDTSAITKRFLPSKAVEESEFAACNEALDEMEIIETESVCEDLSNCIPVTELNAFVKQNGKNNKIKKEFLSLPKGQMYPCCAAKLPDNKFKNRYGNILPYDHSRVILNDSGGSDYIHANYIDGYKKTHKYIATQGPMPDTIADFWFMVWKEKASKIIMISNLVENGKNKCQKYWTDEVTSFGDVKLCLENIETCADFVVRTFSISMGPKNREIKQFHFTSWPDHGVPLNTTPFINFLKKVHSYNVNCESPIVAHCSAGIGRTGAVLLFDCAYAMGIHENQVDVLGLLCSMRKQRMNIVENYDQYIFVYHALVEALCVDKTSIGSSSFVDKYPQFLKSDETTGITSIEKQFQMLNDLPERVLHKNILAAYMINNQAKNRSMHILPDDRARPILRRDSNNADYINAVYIDGYRNKNMFVATQYPLPDTISDFWRMVYELKSRIVVLLQDIPFSDSENIRVCPLEGSQTFDKLDVEFESAFEENDVLITNLRLIHKEFQEEISDVSIRLVQIKSWPVDSKLPPDTSTILAVMKFINTWQKDFTSNVITVTCLDGVTACGIFCVFLHIIDRMKAEQVIDVFQSVKCTRTNRTQFIMNVEQYAFLFELTKTYVESWI